MNANARSMKVRVRRAAMWLRAMWLGATCAIGTMTTTTLSRAANPPASPAVAVPVPAPKPAPPPPPAPVGDDYYKAEFIPGPPGVDLEVGGMDAMPDGRLMICTRKGDVWSLFGAQGVASAGATRQWKLFATGLQEPLGIMHGEHGEVYVMQRCELTRLLDTRGYGVADEYQTVTDAFGFSGNYHEYAYGPVLDKDGNFRGSLNLAHAPDAFGGAFMGTDIHTPYRGWTFKVSPDGKFTPVADGLRSPNGIGVGPDGEIFFTDNQGEYVAADMLEHVKPGAFYNHPSSTIFEPGAHVDPKTTKIEDLAKRRTPPCVIFPYGRMGQSATQPFWNHTQGKFGPFDEQCFVGDMTVPLLMRATLQKLGDDYQGACYPFFSHKPVEGLNRLFFASDGSLYIGLTDRGWGAGHSGLWRMTWSGKTPFELREMRLTQAGFDLEFTQPVDRATALDLAHYDLMHFHYIYHRDYGSPEVDKTPVTLSQVKISDDGKTVSLILPELATGTIYQLNLKNLKNADGVALRNPSAYYTLNWKLGETH